MTYIAKSQRILLYNLFLVCGLLLVINILEGFHMFYYITPFVLFILATVFMNYRFKITNEVLIFQIRVFKLIIFNKKVSNKQIKGINLKRVGWSRRCAVVQNHKGLNFRIVDFNPDTIFDDLIEYANSYKVPISKTKDYILLEKKK